MSGILIIEDNQTMREGMVAVVESMNIPVKSAPDGETGLEMFDPKEFALVVSDYKLPGIDGMEVLRTLKKRSPATEVMMITAFATIDLAVEAMQEGAAEFITKPFAHNEFRTRIKKLLENIEKSAKLHQLEEENVYLREELEDYFNFGEIIGTSASMQKVYRTISKVAATDTSVIVYGESGTGKELVARAIHKASPRKDRPFIRVNCGALAEGVLESELFGHERGAFTGAIRLKKGRFELAHTGSIFLDEIGDVPLSTQVKLLRVLQEREFERVGGEDTLSVDVRVIAATNQELKELVTQGKFREDLYYRLHIIPIELPPLRERGGDIKLLADYFLDRIGKSIGKTNLAMTKTAVELLRSYNWPGNVRELENILERAAVLSDGNIIDADDLPLHKTELAPTVLSQISESDLNMDSAVERLERQLIEKAMEKAHGIKTEAAKILGLKTPTLYYKLEKYGFS